MPAAGKRSWSVSKVHCFTSVTEIPKEGTILFGMGEIQCHHQDFQAHQGAGQHCSEVTKKPSQTAGTRPEGGDSLRSYELLDFFKLKKKKNNLIYCCLQDREIQSFRSKKGKRK